MHLIAKAYYWHNSKNIHPRFWPEMVIIEKLM